MPELRRSARVAARPAKEPEAVTEQPPTKKVKTAPTNTAKPDAGLEIGGKIPDVTLLNQDGEEISLTEVAKGSKYVVILLFHVHRPVAVLDKYLAFENLTRTTKTSQSLVFLLIASRPRRTFKPSKMQSTICCPILRRS